MLNMGCVDSSSSSAFQALFGPELLRSDGTAAPTVELLAVKTAVGIYFSAHWCPPCRQFTPQLAERYKALLAANKELEIVFVSSDREEASFHEYFSSMPWTALPFSARDIKAQLSSKFGVSGIPSLVFLQVTSGGNETGGITLRAPVGTVPGPRHLGKSLRLSRHDLQRVSMHFIRSFAWSRQLSQRC